MSKKASDVTIYYGLRCRKPSKFEKGKTVDAGPCFVECHHLFWDLFRSKYVCGAGRGEAQ
jgi:hypothetical protein